MAERMIQAAEFSAIENRLDAAMRGIEVIATGLDDVDTKVVKVNDELSRLAADFNAYVRRQEFANNKLQAQSVLNDVRAEIERKYGHYRQHPKDKQSFASVINYCGSTGYHPIDNARKRDKNVHSFFSPRYHRKRNQRGHRNNQDRLGYHRPESKAV